ncbi:MAG: DUF4198 domain-containing protein [Fibrobacterota bacterium]
MYSRFNRAAQVCLISISVLYSHYLWVFENGADTFTVARGGIPDDVHPYNPARITSVTAKNSSNKEVEARTEKRGDHLNIIFHKDTPDLIMTTARWGDRVQTDDGKKLMPKDAAEIEGYTVHSTFFSTQYSKTFFTPSEEVWGKNHAQKLEIVPFSNYSDITTGDTLHIQVLFEGYPLAETDIRISGTRDAVARTDENGKAGVELREDALQTLFVRHSIPDTKESWYDTLQYMSFLTFQLQK